MSELGNKKIFADNLKYYMKLNSIDRNSICKILNIPYTTISDWLNAKKYPRIDRIEVLADYFNIEKSDLIESKCKNEAPPDKLDILYKKSKELLNKEDRELIEFTMQRAINRQEEKKK